MGGRIGRRTIILLCAFTAISMGVLLGCNRSENVPRALPVDQEQSKAEKMDSGKLDSDKMNADKEGKVLIVTGEYVPYVGEDLENQGFITEQIEKALTNAGINYRIEFYPWARCSEMVQSGEAWAAYPYGHSEQNDKTYLFSNTVFSTKHKFYYLTENDRITKEAQSFSAIGDFKDYVFGGANGYWYGSPKDFEALGVQVEWADNTDALIKMLYAKRIDFFIEDELVCDEAIQRLFPKEKDKFASLPANAREQDYYMIVSPDYPNTEVLLEQFNSAMK